MDVVGPDAARYTDTTTPCLKRVCHFYFHDNFGKSKPIFIIDSQALAWAWPFSVFTPKTGFWPSYCQISTDLEIFLHTPIVVRGTLVGRLRPRSARGPNQNDYVFISNTYNAP